MLYLFCGLIIGVVMGLTGAGGALVAIPLFIQFLGMPLKQASVYSLLAVALASLINFIAQRRLTNYSIATVIVFFSGVGSFITTPFKKILPEYVMVSLLVAISLYALYSVWATKKKQEVTQGKAGSVVLLSIPVGLILGALTTFTGLGGGVLMMPVILKFYSLNQSAAVATSLLAVGLSSLISFVIQVKSGFEVSWDMNLVYLIVGILASALLLKVMLQRFPEHIISRTRQIVFTVVVVLAIIKVL